MQEMKYIIYSEGTQYVAQCLNVDVSSFGSTIDEAIKNIVEAVELYCEDGDGGHKFMPVNMAIIGEQTINV